MASTVSPIDAGERQGLGENSNTWGQPRLNNALTAAAESAAGRTTIAVGASDITLDSTNFTPSIASHYRWAMHVLNAGASVGSRNIILPGVARVYRFVNNTGFSQTVKTAADTGVTLRSGQSAVVHCDGTTCSIIDPTLDNIKKATAAVDLNGQKLTNIAPGTNPLDATTFNQLGPYAVTASRWASQLATTVVDAFTGVDSGDYSAKEYAVGSTAPAGSAFRWATVTGSAVSGGEYSAKEYAIGAFVGAGSSKSWATITGSAVSGGEFSSKEYAVGTTVAAGSAKRWATSTTVVAGGFFGAYQYALNAAASATLAANWATSLALVDATYYGARKYAIDAANSATAAATFDPSSYYTKTQIDAKLVFATAADIWAGTDAAKIVTGKAIADSEAIQSSTGSGSWTPNCAAGINFERIANGASTLALPTSPIVGRVYSFALTQDATGGRTWAFASGFDFGSAGTPTPSTAANKRDVVYAQCVTSTLFKSTFNKAS
jgi:hypothetical protein